MTNQQRVQVLEQLGAEFARVAERSSTPIWRRHVVMRPLRPLVVALVAIALGSASVAAVVVTRDDADTTGLGDVDNRVTVAEGHTRSGSEWLLTTGNDGEAFCVSLRVIGDRGPEASVVCGGMAPGAFGVGLAEAAGSEEGLLFGTAPASARTVSVQAQNTSAEFRTLEDPSGRAGRFYVVETPGDFGETRIVFSDAGGRALHAPESVSQFLQRSE